MKTKYENKIIHGERLHTNYFSTRASGGDDSCGLGLVFVQPVFAQSNVGSDPDDPLPWGSVTVANPPDPFEVPGNASDAPRVRADAICTGAMGYLLVNWMLIAWSEVDLEHPSVAVTDNCRTHHD